MAKNVRIEGLTEVQSKLIATANNFENGKHAKKFMRKAGQRLRTLTKSEFQASGAGTVEPRGGFVTGDIAKGFKYGKVRKMGGSNWCIDVNNTAFAAHWLNNGHKIVRGGNTVGFSPGYHYFEKAKAGYETEYFAEMSHWIDEMLYKEGLR